MNISPARPEEQSGDAVEEPSITLGPGEAENVARLLELLSEFPSTPGLIAEEAGYRASVVAALLPFRKSPPEHRPAIDLGHLDAVAIAGLLDLLGEMPSTPPAVAEDARGQAEAMWKRLE